jgi:hypothetical protein
VSRVPAAWDPVRPPFRSLAAGLAAAEDLLERGGPAWRRLAAAVDDHPAAARVLDDLLTGLTLGVRRTATGRWRVVVDGAERDRAEVAAALALALLVESGGWARIKRCRRCGRVFPDATNGRTRAGCRRHPARRPPLPVTGAGCR